MASEPDRSRWLALGEFPHSTAQIRRAGDRIARASKRGEQPSEDDLRLLDDFRAAHYPTLRQVHERLARLLHKRFRLDPETFRVTARPLKTQEAIIAKLVRERTRLTTMQDIAGTRVVVPSLRAQDAVLTAVLESFKRCKPIIARDSREDADRYGYRAVHVVVTMGGRLAEIQVRTRAQEIWAQTVERLDEAMGTDLKHGRGPAEWLEWLHALSDALRQIDLGNLNVDIPPSPWDELIEQ